MGNKIKEKIQDMQKVRIWNVAKAKMA